jgi:hypothetical protein
MASTTKTRARDTAGDTAADVGTAVEAAGDRAANAARRTPAPLLAAGAAAVGLAGGWAVGARGRSRRRGRVRRLAPRPRLLGVPIGRRSGALRAAEALRDGARHLHATGDRVVGAADDLREIREELEKVNRRSPLEVVLDGLTHRRGVHRRGC